MIQRQAHAISPTRQEDFPEWYQQVVQAADLAENAAVRGCMVIKPWGYGIWERMQQELDRQIKGTGCSNAYFPLFIPLSFFEREAAHVEGFAKECAVVTHHRLEERAGKLVPAAPLEEPLVVRPTSEMIIGESLARWIDSWRDLPLAVNQWANIVRWEMRPRLFLRTVEFLWQEGHTVHATEEDARARTLQMLEVYRAFMEEHLLLPVIVGEKSAGERFPGAAATYTLEAIMQDGKALQAGTSHYLGQSFSKAASIRFSDAAGALQYAHTTSWGVTTRMIGALIMTHGDDDGLRLPPRIAPSQLVILPVVPKPEFEPELAAAAHRIADRLRATSWQGEPLRVEVDIRPKRGGEKSWEWIKKGVPLRLELGPRDLERSVVQILRRDRGHKEREECSVDGLERAVQEALSQYELSLWQRACATREELITSAVTSPEELEQWFSSEGAGPVRGKWCGDPATEELLKPMKATIRCLPLQQSGAEGCCLLTGRPASCDVLFARSY